MNIQNEKWCNKFERSFDNYNDSGTNNEGGAVVVCTYMHALNHLSCIVINRRQSFLQSFTDPDLRWEGVSRNTARSGSAAICQKLVGEDYFICS